MAAERGVAPFDSARVAWPAKQGLLGWTFPCDNQYDDRLSHPGQLATRQHGATKSWRGSNLQTGTTMAEFKVECSLGSELGFI